MDCITTMATSNWSDAVAVWVDGLATHAAGLAPRIIVYRDAPMACEDWCRQRDGRVEFRDIAELGHPGNPWNEDGAPPMGGRCPLTKWDHLVLYKWALLGMESLGRKVLWLDVDLLIRGSLEGLAQYGDISMPEAWGVWPPADKGGGPALSFGLCVYRPSVERARRVFDYARTMDKPRYACDQNVLDRYLWANEAEHITVVPNGLHANTRARHYQYKAWQDTGCEDAAIWHYAGIKPWDKRTTNHKHAPWWGMFNEWRRACNSLGCGGRYDLLPQVDVAPLAQ